jgi:hypothetical protein
MGGRTDSLKSFVLTLTEHNHDVVVTDLCSRLLRSSGRAP